MIYDNYSLFQDSTLLNDLHSRSTVIVEFAINKLNTFKLILLQDINAMIFTQRFLSIETNNCL